MKLNNQKEKLIHKFRGGHYDMKNIIPNDVFMKRFGEKYPDLEFVQSLAAQIPWTLNVLLME